MSVRIIRVCFALACMVMGAIWGYSSKQGEPIAFNYGVAGGAAGIGVALVLIFALKQVTQDLFDKLWPVFVAIVVAMTGGYCVGMYVIFWARKASNLEELAPLTELYILTTAVLLCGFVGISMGLTHAANWKSLMKNLRRQRFDSDNLKLIDTSVLIDGRIADVCATDFIDGALIIPRFVLKELHSIADSADTLRRVRGRRGLDIVKTLQGPDSKVTVSVIEDDPENIAEVDNKLVALAREMGAKIITNDFNLSKVALIDGVDVLNLNDLANALKPAVLPDEEMRVKLVKEGKEPLQGVGYLDDGTMIVVDGGKDHVGKEVSVVVTSVLQTSAGRMIFTRLQSVLT